MSELTQHGSTLTRFPAPRIYYSRIYEREGWMLCALSSESPIYRVNYLTRQIACYCEGDITVYDCPSLDILSKEILDIHIFLVLDQCPKMCIDSNERSVRYYDLVRFLTHASTVHSHLSDASRLALMASVKNGHSDELQPDIVFSKKMSFHQQVEIAFYRKDDVAIPVMKMLWSAPNGKSYDLIKPTYFYFQAVSFSSLQQMIFHSSMDKHCEVNHA